MNRVFSFKHVCVCVFPRFSRCLHQTDVVFSPKVKPRGLRFRAGVAWDEDLHFDSGGDHSGATNPWTAPQAGKTYLDTRGYKSTDL